MSAGLGIIGLAQIAGFVYVVRLVIAPVVESVRALTAQVDALYNSRNGHEVRITKVETIHQMKGCDMPPHNRREEDR